MSGEASSVQADFITSSQDFFREMVREACLRRQIESSPGASGYLVDLLHFYMNTNNLFDEEDLSGRRTRETLAELFLKAGSAQRSQRIELLKKLGDTALYISGFFGESLQRKIVDVDYYKGMGCAAYGHLAVAVERPDVSQVYYEFSRRFTDYVDVLAYISEKSIRPPANNLLLLFERYVKTGSQMAQDQIFERGLVTTPDTAKKFSQ